MNKKWLAFAFVGAALVFAGLVFNDLPERVPTHFNVRGEPDGWSNRWAAAFGMPFLGLVMIGVFHLLPKIGPRREHMDRFHDTYWFVATVVIGFMSALHVLVLGRALGWPIDITSASLLGVGMLFMIIGNVLPRMRSNWFMGIRTPWTMESESVWRDTHRLAGKTFMAGGALTVVAAVLPIAIRPWIAIGALVVAGFIPVVYSYVLWRREKAAEFSR